MSGRRKRRQRDGVNRVDDMDNRTRLGKLIAHGAIELSASARLDRNPPSLPPDFDFDRIDGMMLGLAIGDALGGPSEGRQTGFRRAKYGEVRDYMIGRRAKRALGYPSDDTQLAFWTLDQINADGGFVPKRVARRFCRGKIFGIGQTVAGFRRNMKANKPWFECGPQSAGNGALMRIAPMVIPHLSAPSSALWADTALSAMMTHNDSGSNATCLAFVDMLWHLLALERGSAPASSWWVAHYVDVAREFETGTSYRPRGGAFQDFEGMMWQFVDEYVPEALERGLSTVDACDAWYSGAYLLETVPSVLYILARYAGDPEEAIVRAVNDTKDNDTVAAIVGAAVGALHGKDGLPRRWIDNLTGRTEANDDGRVFEILARARERWAPAA